MFDESIEMTEEQIFQLLPGWQLIPWNQVPVQSMRTSIRNYILWGQEPSQFLQAVIQNNLRDAVARADDTNSRHVCNWVRFLYNEAPAGCWGSPEAYKYWVGKHGLQGIAYPKGEPRDLGSAAR